MRRFILLVVLALIPGLSHGLSFIYDGFECVGDASPGTTKKQSRFEVIEDMGSGAYRIIFTGGLPLFSSGAGPCVGNAFGVETTETSDGKQVKKSDAQAMAYFTGSHLIITLTTLNSYGDGQVIGGMLVMSSIVYPQTYTWIFEFVPETISFKLIRNIAIMDTVSSMGSVESGKVMGTLIVNAPYTAVPGTSIEYRRE